jgi:hypothetical protein
MQIKKSVLLFLFFFSGFVLFNPTNGYAQFYNGHQMNFGKNRVQFDEFEWYYYRFNQFDTYYYLGGTEIAKRTAQLANTKIPELEKYFDYSLSQRLIFVVYQNLSDFRQSNIGLNTGDQQYNIGGVTKIIDNIVFLYIEGDQEKLEQQITAAIAEVILNEMLYGSEFTNKVANNTLMSTPDWYFYGLINYVSQNWNYDIDNKVKDGILTKKYEEFNHLSGEDAIYAGHSIWNYIASNYGDQTIPTIIYLTRVTKNVESGFLYVLGTSLKLLSYDWIRYYENIYLDHANSCDLSLGETTPKRSKKDWKYYEPKLSPNGDYLIYARNFMGRYKIVLLDLLNNKKTVIERGGHKLEQISDYSYPVLAWHPGGKLIGYFIEKKGSIWYISYQIETKEKIEKKLASLDKATSFDYSSDGLKLVISGFANGMSDIYLFNIPANTITNLTHDIADDYSPQFINNTDKIIFSSKRSSDTLVTDKNIYVGTQKYRDLFIIDLKTPDKLTQLTNTPETDEKKAVQHSDDKFYFLSNENGIFNRYQGVYDSIISYVDTTTHYRFFTNQIALTNYQSSILDFDINKAENKVSELIFINNKYKIYTSIKDNNTKKDLIETPYRRIHKEQLRTESIPKPIKQTVRINTNEDNTIDINNYKFDDVAISKNESQIQEFDSTGYPKNPRNNRYFTTFYTNYVVNQIDFGFLSSSYQPFTGSAFYFNPGFNILLKLGAEDLFENYRITGGFRFSGNFDSNEYLLSFEDLHKRLNKQYVFHRLSLNTSNGYNYVKTHTHEFMYILRYPFNQVSALQFTINARNDIKNILSLDYQSLNEPNQMDFWTGVKMEYIFDNSRVLLPNIYDGWRFKAFGEYYYQLDKKESDLYVFGADLRYYQPIHRNLILALRVAGSGSFGKSKLIYYLGGIDNWINLSTNTQTFDPTVRIDPDANYVYQAVATNMRGFSQNIRNGTNFALFNAEIRWPVISYFINRPMNSAFLKNLQVVGFFDLGSAWNGLTPFSGENAYENDVYQNNPITVIIDNENYPIVAGYGLGLRSKLFGYFIRADWAWGIENNVKLPGIFYLSLSLDF